MNRHFKPGNDIEGLAAQGTPLPHDERRRSRRHRVLYRALAVFDGKTMNCSMRDISEHGCKLKFAVTPLLPEFFELRLQKPIRRFKCQLVWVSQQEAGVRFVR